MIMVLPQTWQDALVLAAIIGVLYVSLIWATPQGQRVWALLDFVKFTVAVLICIMAACVMPRMIPRVWKALRQTWRGEQ